MQLIERKIQLVLDLSDELEEMNIKSLYGENLEYVSEDGERYQILIAKRAANTDKKRGRRTI